MARPITPWTAAEIASITQGTLHGDSAWQALEVSTDTRQITSGQLFLALNGANFRGADFVAKAKAQGAVAAVVDMPCEVDLPQIVVRDTLQALQALAVERRNRSGAKFIALTGSNGKTTTKEMLARILARVAPTLATQGNLNNDIGVPLTLLRLRDSDAFAVIEMGANHPDDIRHLVPLARPDVALITNVAAAHLEGFGSLEGVFRTKSDIFKYSDGAIVYNDDLTFSPRWQETFASRVKRRFSIAHKADVWASDIAADGSDFTLHIGDKTATIAWQMRGKHNVANALAACAAADLLGISLADMASALQNLALHQSRLSAYEVGVHTLYDDTYNANPASFKAGIDVVATAKNSLVIAGSMGELGAQSDALHREVADYARDRGVNEFWAVNAPQYGDSARHFASIEEAVAALTNVLAQETPYSILVKGSRSARMERVLEGIGIKREKKD